MLRLTRLALRFPGRWLAGTLLLTAVFVFGLSRLELDTDGAALYPAANPLIEASRADGEVFGDGPLLLVLVRRQARGPVVASPAGLSFLRRLDTDLRRLPGVRSAGVLSLASLREVTVTPAALGAAPYLDRLPGETGAWDARLREIRRHPLVDGALLSRDGTLAAIYVPLVASAPRREVLARVERRAAEPGPFDVEITGPVVAEARLGDSILTDLGILVPFMVAALLWLFWLQLRTVGALLVVTVEVGVVLVTTMGAMGLAGVPLTLVTTLLPLLLMAIAITDEVHLLERFQGYLARDLAAPAPGTAPGVPERAAVPGALLTAMGELERPAVAAALTTALGFLAFPASSIVPLRHFGLFSTLGLAVAVLVSFTTVPALISRLPARWFLPARRADAASRVGRILPYEAFLARHPRAGLAAAGACILLALPGLPRIEVGDNWIANFPPASALVRTDALFNRAFWGSYRFDVVLEGSAGFFFRPEGVRQVESLERMALRQGDFSGVAGVLSYRTPLSEIARAFGDEGALGALPRERLEDYLSLAAMSEDPWGLPGWVTADGRRARLRLFLKSESYPRDRRLRESLDAGLARALEGSGVRHRLGGDIPVGLEMVDTVVSNQLRSIALTGLCTALFLFAVERSWRFVGAAVLPVLAATLLVFAGMGYFGVPLGVATSLFASLTIGVGIDFALHFLHSCRQEARLAADPARALEAAFGKTGRALRRSVVILVLGFAVLTFSGLRPTRSLGFLLSAAMVASYAMTVLCLPALAPRLQERPAGEPR